ncbi:MAG: SPOR domain-containing protein [Candidatus Fermentibacteraceae bacterium]
MFVDSEGAYHKVRVGSFENREQALALQASVRALGYSDAWVVER